MNPLYASQATLHHSHRGVKTVCHHLTFVVCFFLMSATMTFASDTQPVVLEDFSNLPESRWEFIADTVMGGVSTGNVQFLSKDGQGFLKLSGKVSTENNGGFIQARMPLDMTSTHTLPDSAQGIWLKARGNNQPYFVHVRTSGTVLPWQYYQATFEVTDQWQDIKLAWEDFKPSGGLSGSFLRDVPLAGKIKSIAIVAFGRDHQADVEVAEIGYY
jgi:hypothetical protein